MIYKHSKCRDTSRDLIGYFEEKKSARKKRIVILDYSRKW